MIIGQATYESDDLVIEFTARGFPSDYGVPGSPTFVEWDDVEIASVRICGFGVKLSDLPKSVQAALLDKGEDVYFEEQA